MVDKSLWTRRVEANPEHSTWYLQRFRDMATSGQDLGGEARLVDAMLPPRSRILDAGCGPGRVGNELARRGHTVVGVDVDPVLIEAARHDFPDATWLVQDLAELDRAALGGPFDAIVCAGNVATFLAPSTRRLALGNLREVLTSHGRAAFGFGAGRGYGFDEFLADATAVGWTRDLLLSTWDLRPFSGESDFLVAILRPR